MHGIFLWSLAVNQVVERRGRDEINFKIESYQAKQKNRNSK